MILDCIGCLLFWVVEIFVGVAIPAYLGLRLVSETVKPSEDISTKENLVRSSLYWVIIIVTWKIFEYLTFLPFHCIIRLVLTIGLVSPKLGLVN